MSDLIQSVTDGIVKQANTAAASESNNKLDKDAFLQLLVTQMKYQDPLNPSTDTEYIAQLATFSQLEQLQNLATASTTTQAFNMVGKNVIIKTENTTGNTTYISGRVDFVNMAGGKAKLSINGSLYSIDQLDSVIDDTYLIEKGLPGLSSKIELKHDADNPKDLSFTVNLGQGRTVADKVAIAIDKEMVDNKYITVTGSKVTIDDEAFANLENGTYKLTLVFNDSLLTVVDDMATLKVTNSKADLTNSGTA